MFMQNNVEKYFLTNSYMKALVKKKGRGELPIPAACSMHTATPACLCAAVER